MNDHAMDEPRFRITGKLVFGLFLVVWGALLTLDQLGIADMHHALRWWPLVFVAYGFVRLTGFASRQSTTAGAIFMLIGGVLLLGTLRVVRFSVWDLWPILLILLGAKLVMRTLRAHRYGDEWQGGPSGPGGGAAGAPSGGASGRGYSAKFSYTMGGPAADASAGAGAGAGAATGAGPGSSPGGGFGASADADSWETRHHWSRSTTNDPRIHVFAMWSGMARKVVSNDFRGGDVTAIMGGHEIDLRSARMASGSAELDLTVIWGGVQLRVPEDWHVSCDATVILGGVDDKSRQPGPEARGHLRLTGTVIMGGVEVKN